jgi:hypothetical protein
MPTMSSPASLSDVLTALQMASAALQRVAPLLPDDENHSLKFTGKWAHFGTLTIAQILDRADTALEPEG